MECFSSIKHAHSINIQELLVISYVVGPAPNNEHRDDGNYKSGLHFQIKSWVGTSISHLQVAEDAGKQGFWDKLRNTFVRE